MSPPTLASEASPPGTWNIAFNPPVPVIPTTDAPDALKYVFMDGEAIVATEAKFIPATVMVPVITCPPALSCSGFKTAYQSSNIAEETTASITAPEEWD